jgi:cytochrome c-type biogenesis protein CcmE
MEVSKQDIIDGCMSARTAKISLTTLVLVTAFGGLLWSTMAEGTEYYKHVDEVMAAPEQWYGKKLKLHGYVVKDSILRKRDGLEYRFKVENKGHVVQASYTGIVPDTFKDSAEVVVTGTLGPHGFDVDRNGVMAKCPSKYEAKPGAVHPDGVPRSPGETAPTPGYTGPGKPSTGKT